MKNNECFNCLYHLEGELAENTGWYYSCNFGFVNSGLQDLSKCKNYEPNKGFQIDGHYTFTHFESDGGNCLELFIHGDGEFPSDDPEKWIQFHICDFRQIEQWVEFWGKELRKKGLVKNS